MSFSDMTNNSSSNEYGRKINKLSPDCAKLIRSSLVITSPTQILYELMLNSIDSGAFKISITFDMITMNITIIDNGNGISPQDFKHCAEHNSTSRISCFEDLRNSSFYGFRGESLACIGDISYLQIESKVLFEDEPSVKIIQEGRLIYCGFLSKCNIHSNPLHLDDGSFGESWTKIQVNSLFNNQPVRRRHLFHTSLSTSDHSSDITPANLSENHGTKRNISVGKRWGRSLLSVARSIWMLLPQLSISFLAKGTGEEDISFTSGSGDTDKAMFCFLFGLDKVRHLHSLQFSSQRNSQRHAHPNSAVSQSHLNHALLHNIPFPFTFSFTGIISTPGYGTSSKQIQFVFVNGRICKGTPLHTLLNDLLCFSYLPDGFLNQQ